MGPPWDVEMKCSNVQGHMTKLLPSPYMVKTLTMTLKLGIQHRVLKYHQICSNDDIGLTFSVFMIWSNLFHNASARVKAYIAHIHIFSSLF